MPAMSRCAQGYPSEKRCRNLAAVMALAARSGYGLFCRLLPERWAVLPAVLLAAVVYVVLALAIGAVTRQDLQTLPKGEKLADRLHLR